MHATSALSPTWPQKTTLGWYLCMIFSPAAFFFHRIFLPPHFSSTAFFPPPHFFPHRIFSPTAFFFHRIFIYHFFLFGLVYWGFHFVFRCSVVMWFDYPFPAVAFPGPSLFRPTHVMIRELIRNYELAKYQWVTFFIFFSSTFYCPGVIFRLGAACLYIGVGAWLLSPSATGNVSACSISGCNILIHFIFLPCSS